jgi:leader peptidase (prepilin peptidase)/N-methyltransferase
MIAALTFIFGLCIGSFLNVCIYRLPNSKSIVFPPSACPACEEPIRFYDNIPILSYILLRGKCRACKTNISLRYPLVELMSGLFAFSIYLKFGASLDALITYCFLAALITVIYIDIDHWIIPDSITLPGILVGLAASFFIHKISFVDSVLGVLIGGGTLWIVAFGYQLLMKKEGMGGGDIKLLAMIGAFIGWKGVLLTIFLSSLIGTIANIPGMLLSKKFFNYKLPFGPFIAIAAIVDVFFGQEIIALYVNTFLYG